MKQIMDGLGWYPGQPDMGMGNPRLILRRIVVAPLQQHVPSASGAVGFQGLIYGQIGETQPPESKAILVVTIVKRDGAFCCRDRSTKAKRRIRIPTTIVARAVVFRRAESRFGVKGSGTFDWYVL